MTDDETWVEGDHANTLNRFDVGDTRTTHAIVTGTYPIDDGRPVEKHQNGTGIGEDGAPAYTLDRQQHAAVVQPELMTVRRLTPVECERLMGLPDGWTAPSGVKAPNSKRYAACGDAIVTTVAFWIADRIRMIEEEEEAS
jgi:site-specific DNA-cytosine methylase